MATQEYEEVIASNLTVGNTDFHGKTLVVNDVNVGGELMSQKLQSLKDEINAKQDKISVAGKLKLENNVLSLDTGFLNTLVEKNNVSTRINDSVKSERQMFMNSMASIQTDLYNKMEEKYKPVDSLNGDQTKSPTVKAVNEAIMLKQDALLTQNGSRIDTVVDSTPTAGHIDRLVTSAGVAASLASKVDVGEVILPAVSRSITRGDYSTMASGGAVYDHVRSILNGDGVALGTGATKESGKLKFKNTVVVGTDGKIPIESISGLEQTMASVKSIQGMLNGFHRMNYVIRNPGLTSYYIEPSSEYYFQIESKARIYLILPGLYSSKVFHGCIIYIKSSVNQKKYGESGDGFELRFQGEDGASSDNLFVSSDPAVFSMIKKNVDTAFFIRGVRVGKYMVSRLELFNVSTY